MEGLAHCCSCLLLFAELLAEPRGTCARPHTHTQQAASSYLVAHGFSTTHRWCHIRRDLTIAHPPCATPVQISPLLLYADVANGPIISAAGGATALVNASTSVCAIKPCRYQVVYSCFGPAYTQQQTNDPILPVTTGCGNNYDINLKYTPNGINCSFSVNLFDGNNKLSQTWLGDNYLQARWPSRVVH